MQSRRLTLILRPHYVTSSGAQRGAALEAWPGCTGPCEGRTPSPFQPKASRIPLRLSERLRPPRAPHCGDAQCLWVMIQPKPQTPSTEWLQPVALRPRGDRVGQAPPGGPAQRSAWAVGSEASGPKRQETEGFFQTPLFLGLCLRAASYFMIHPGPGAFPFPRLSAPRRTTHTHSRLPCGGCTPRAGAGLPAVPCPEAGLLGGAALSPPVLGPRVPAPIPWLSLPGTAFESLASQASS